MEIILASGSPRRKEILTNLRVPFTVLKTDTDESYEEGLAPDRIVTLLSSRKADAAAAVLNDPGDRLILAADTIVFCDGNVLEKPKSPENAADMLHALSGRTHTVWSGLCAVYHGKKATSAVATDVTFRSLTEKEILDYVATGEPLDKAGAYGIQGFGGLLVKEIRGEYLNAVGLPASALSCMLSDAFGFSLADLRER